MLFLSREIAVAKKFLGVGGDVRVRKTIVSLDHDVMPKLACSSSFIR